MNIWPNQEWPTCGTESTCDAWQNREGTGSTEADGLESRTGQAEEGDKSGSWGGHGANLQHACQKVWPPLVQTIHNFEYMYSLNVYSLRAW